MSYADPRTLLAALLGAPALPGARCRGKPHLFDPAEPGEPADLTAQRHTQALGLCQHCTALPDCTTWFDTLPRHRRPTGIVAGQDRTPKPQRGGRGATRHARVP